MTKNKNLKISGLEKVASAGRRKMPGKQNPLRAAG
jgi:hypothetical protein